MTSEATRSIDDPEVPRLDGFEDLTEIGRGGFSVVFSATQTAFGRRVAVKVLNLSGDEARRSEREARALGRLSDLPHVVQAHQVLTTDDGRPALVMSLMPGSIGRLIKQQGRVEPERALVWLEQVARALDAAHGMGVHHRDVKPENVLLSGWGDAHLADFGIAGVDGLVASTTTEFAFSPPHAPPERLMGTEADLVAGDLYSLASTFFTILTGRTPFGTTSDGGVYGLTQRVVNEDLPCPPGLPPAAHAVFSRAMAKAPADRYRSAREFAADLTAAYGSSATPATQDSPAADGSGSKVVLDPRLPANGGHAPPQSQRAEDHTRIRPPESQPTEAGASSGGARSGGARPTSLTPPPFTGVVTPPTVIPDEPDLAEEGRTIAPPPTGDRLPDPGGAGGHGDRRGRRRALMAVTAVLALAAIGVGVWALLNNPAEPPSAPLAAGGTHTCVLATDGSGSCWGADGGGQLGDSSIGGYATRSTSVADLSGMDELSLGNVHTCAVDVEGNVRCWGRNDAGQLGDGSTNTSPRPVAVRGLGPAAELATGREHTCALIDDGTVWCWGENTQRQLGGASGDQADTPVQVEGIDGVRAIAAGNAFTCVILRDRTVSCWGDNQFGQVGSAAGEPVPNPTPVSGIRGARSITAGPGHACVLAADGVWCWGSNATGELGADVSVASSSTPVRVDGLDGVVAVSAGGSLSGSTTEGFSTVGHTCALLEDRTVSCWGDNSVGQLGDGSNASSSQPVRVKDLDGVVELSAGGGPKLDEERRIVPHAHTCVQRSDRSVWCWGDNSHGQLGDGTRTASREPVKVSDR